MALKSTKFNPISHTHDDRYYTESEMNTKLAAKSDTTHTHGNITVYGNNTITSTTNDKIEKWVPYGNSVHFYNTLKQLTDQPNQYGYLINIGGGSEVHQIWCTQTSGALFHRGGNASGWSGTWREILDSSNYSSFCATRDHTHAQYYDSNASRTANTVLAAPNGSNGGASFRKLVAADIPSLSYVPTSGGTITGSLTVNYDISCKRSLTTYGIEVYHSSTPFIDFHYGNNSSVDYTSRIIENASGILNINGATFTIGGSVWCPTLSVDNAINGKLNGCAKTLARNGDLNYPMAFSWNGQEGQPTWLWGGENGIDMYVYNPSNFNVNSAKYLSLKGTNTYQGSDDNTGNWGTQGFSLHWYNAAYMKKQPSTYMYVMNWTLGGAEVHQIACAQPGGSLYHRGGNSNGWSPSDGSWATIVDTTNSNDTLHIKYVYDSAYETYKLLLNNSIYVLDYGTGAGVSLISYKNSDAGISIISGTSWCSIVGWYVNGTSLGTSENNWNNVYVGGNVIRSSDEKLKDIIDTGIDERYEKFFLKLNPILYKWKNGDERSKMRPHDRIHCGLGARETEKHAIECGLDSISVALICKDKLDTPREDGTDDIYSLAYSELHGLEIHMIQKLYKKNEELEKKNEELKARLAALEAKLL